MSIPAWYWPLSGAAARGVSLVPYGAGGLAVPDWTTSVVWPFSVSNLAFQQRLAYSTGTPGFAPASSDGANGLWTATWSGTLYHVSSGGAVLSSGAMPSGMVYTGTSPSGHVLASSGAVLTSAAAALGSWPAAAWFLASTGSTLLSIVGASGLGTMASGTGATGFVAIPTAFSTPSCLSVSSGNAVGMAGWRQAPPLSGAAAAALDPQDGTATMAVGSGFALLWRAPAVYADAWAQTQALTGLANLSAMAWRPDGTQVLAPSVVSGAVQVIGYSAGIMSLLQTLTVSGACSVAVAGDSTHALVAQSGQSQLATLAYGGATWTTGTPVTGLPGIAAVAAFGATGAVAAWTSGLSFLGLTAGVWSVLTSAALAFAPKVVTVDPWLRVYAAGSGSVAVFSGSTALGSGSWTGAAPTAIAVQEGRTLLAVPSDSLIRIFGQATASSWTQQGSAALALGAQVGLGLSTTTLFALGSGSTVTYGFSGTPFTLTQVLSGAGGIWNGASWTSAAFGVGHTPACCAFDSSGTLWVATTQNTLWSITSGGVAASGTIQQYAGQAQTVPLGISALCWSGGSLWGATSVPGVLEQIR